MKPLVPCRDEELVRSETYILYWPFLKLEFDVHTIIDIEYTRAIHGKLRIEEERETDSH